jgi:hypothetical protein
VNLKKLVLEVKEDLDFLLLGLVSQFKASKLAYFLNQIDPLSLERIEDLQLPDFNPKADISFSRFSFTDEENHLDFILVANKEHGNCFFNELKQFDFLLTVRGGIDFFDTSDFTRKCMLFQGVDLVAPIKNEKIKSKLSWIV